MRAVLSPAWRLSSFSAHGPSSTRYRYGRSVTDLNRIDLNRASLVTRYVSSFAESSTPDSKFKLP